MWTVIIQSDATSTIKQKQTNKKDAVLYGFFFLFQPSFLGRRVGVLSARSAVEVLAVGGGSGKELVVFSIIFGMKKASSEGC